MIENNYRRTETTISSIQYHFAFCSRYKRKIFNIPGLESRFRELTEDICKEIDINIITINCNEDHIQMTLDCLPTISPSDIMNKIKGNTSRVLRGEFLELKSMSGLWTRKFLISTGNNLDDMTVKKFVDEQKNRP